MPNNGVGTLDGHAQIAPEHRLPASFRDPAGYVFQRDDVLYRRVAAEGAEAYAALMGSGLYAELTHADVALLIPHEEISTSPETGTLTLRPEPIPFISYPYEWCFGQLQDAALATLEIQRRALERGLSLKDASAYNIQFHEGRPLLIDTLSFEPYREGQPWAAYKQFCQHFLAPLALMSYVDPGLSRLLRVHLDGVPLDLASKLLPRKTYLKPGLLTHLHLHASAQNRFANNSQATADTSPAANRNPSVSKQGLLGILDSLRGTVSGLRYAASGTVWDRYYSKTNYSNDAMDDKERIVASFLDAIVPTPERAWDLGANNGKFSQLCADRGISTIAWDIDYAAVEQNWRACRERGEKRVLPLVQDLTNPSPSLGWAEVERDGFVERGRGRNGVVLALALIHHLAITNNLPLRHIAKLFADLCIKGSGHLIVEWVPAEDSQSQRLLASRDGMLSSYQLPNFLAAFESEFEIVSDVPVVGTMRRLYLMRQRSIATDRADLQFAVSSRGAMNEQDPDVDDSE